MADILRIHARDMDWRERRRYFGRPLFRGCGCGPGCGGAGCSFLEGFACAEILSSCGGEACCIPGCGISAITLLLPFSNWFYPFLHMAQLKRIPTLHRECPNCGSGWFERIIAKYEEQGTKRTVESVSWQLPVVNAIQATPISL
jgi:hypothetical protein